MTQDQFRDRLYALIQEADKDLQSHLIFEVMTGATHMVEIQMALSIAKSMRMKAKGGQ